MNRATLRMHVTAAAESQAARPAAGSRLGGCAALAVRPRHAFAGQQLRQEASNGSRCRAFFKIKKKDEAPSKYHEFHTPEHRGDYTAAEVKEYYNYMGMLAHHGSYERLESLLASGKHPADLLLLMAVEEGDEGKVEELLEAGADITITDDEGKTPLDLATKAEVKELLQEWLAGV